MPETKKDPAFRTLSVTLRITPAVRRELLEEYGDKIEAETALIAAAVKWLRPFEHQAKDRAKSEALDKKAAAEKRKRDAAARRERREAEKAEAKAKREEERKERRLEKAREMLSPEEILSLAEGLAEEKGEEGS